MWINRARQFPSVAVLAMVAALIMTGCARPAAAVQPSVPTAEPTRGPGSQPTSSGERISGTVQTVDSGKITLTDGKTLTLAPDTQIIRIQLATSADLQPGGYVAITASRQPDNTLLASAVNIFAESQRGLGAGQRPMTGGNLMTNATIVKVDGDTFTATFPGGDDTVKLAPDVKVMKFVPAGPQDIVSGTMLSALVTNGVVKSLSLQ